MTRREYTDTVLSALRRVTEDERRAIRAEIDAHMEDHICALLDLGYDEPLAEERTVALMGDPKEVGRELNKQYTGWGFVLLSRAAVALTLCCASRRCWDWAFYQIFYGVYKPERYRMRLSAATKLWLRSGRTFGFQWVTMSCGSTGLRGNPGRCAGGGSGDGGL